MIRLCIPELGEELMVTYSAFRTGSRVIVAHLVRLDRPLMLM